MAKILYIFIAEKGMAPEEQQSVDVSANQGVVGDRYFNVKGRRKSEITFIAAEEIDRFNKNHASDLDYGNFRRNVITQGVDLNSLVGKVFEISGVQFEGIEKCEPCAYLADTVHPKVLPDLIGRAGLRASILNSGRLEAGDEVNC